MTAIPGAAVAVTGAASGIGRALGDRSWPRAEPIWRSPTATRRAAVGRGRNRQDPPGRPAGERSACTASISASREAVTAFAREAIAAHPTLNIVINNAGVALLGQFHEIDQAQMEWLFNINFWGVVHSTRAFLPHLASQPAAHIVNLSSIFGIVAPPGQTAYAAAKFAVRGFSESLRHELQMAQSPVRLSVVHPGGIKTNIVRNSRTGSGVTDNERRAEIDRAVRCHRADQRAKDAALRIIKGIEKNEPRILIGGDARFMDILQRFRPATYWHVMAKRVEKASKPEE